MKINKLHLLLALAGLLVTTNSINANVSRARESDIATHPYAADSLAFIKSATDEDNFYTGRAGEVEDQRKAAAAAYTKSLENKVKSISKDVQQIKKEHAQLKNNVEKRKQ